VRANNEEDVLSPTPFSARSCNRLPALLAGTKKGGKIQGRPQEGWRRENPKHKSPSMGIKGSQLQKRLQP
jgi:hypothetical protein